MGLWGSCRRNEDGLRGVGVSLKQRRRDGADSDANVDEDHHDDANADENEKALKAEPCMLVITAACYR